MALFWDSQDLAEWEDPWEEVAEQVFQRGTAVQIPLDSQQAATAEQLAAVQGTALPALIQQWISEHVVNP